LKKIGYTLYTWSDQNSKALAAHHKNLKAICHLLPLFYSGFQLHLASNWLSTPAMKPYSNNLRRKIVGAYESGNHSLDEVADLFGVSLATVKNFVRRKRLTGSSDALPHAGGKEPSLSDNARMSVQQAINENNDLTLKELRKLLKRKHKKEVSLPTISRLLHTLGLPRKKSRSTRRKQILPEFSRREANTGKK
jgi:transposase